MKKSLLALTMGLIAALLVPLCLGESPFEVLNIIALGAFGSKTQFGYSLFDATPLIFTGLSVAWAAQAGLFNIGAEGQMTLGGLGAVSVGLLLPNLPWWLALPLAALAAFTAGGLWGLLAGWMKAYRGCHEVLSTILLNFIAYGVTAYFILHVFKNPDSQTPETLTVGAGYQLAILRFIGGVSPLNGVFFFALAMAAVCSYVSTQTLFGYRQRVSGGAPEAALRSGLNICFQTLSAMFIAGGLAGCAALSPLLGSMMKLREGAAGGAGFVGIAVALLGRNRPIGVIVSAILFGALAKGALDLEIDTQHMTRDLAVVLQAMVILSVVSYRGWHEAWLKLRLRWRRHA
jgi:ABC-type uncharacterized transport system permease subunit